MANDSWEKPEKPSCSNGTDKPEGMGKDQHFTFLRNQDMKEFIFSHQTS